MNCSPLISTPVIMQPRRHLQILKLLLVGLSTNIQLAILTTRRRRVALKTSDTKDKVPAVRRAPGSEGDPSDGKVTTFHASVRIPAVTQDLRNYFRTTTDTKGKTPAMGRARSSEDLPLSWMPFNTLYITLHSDEPP
ncbi:hypothetical protein T02_4102 [Trichinella nativa]|uniref:Uncharacterized protein n=1 Tax=Trichinella nativa TaxID=6335 RepID=A0A0V1KJT1_9BILA|nr:hypothetical protein T02_4102 [Trichinella nativa]